MERLSHNDALLEVECSNCYRRHVELHLCCRNDVKKHNRKKYYFLCTSEVSISCYLCKDCKNYLFSQTTSPQRRDYWAAMTYKFLTFVCNDNIGIRKIPLLQRWKYIPQAWRIWWWHLMREDIHENDNNLPLFVDTTKEYYMVKEDLKNLNWIKLATMMDKFMACPTVRCPWGCSEFLHACNYVNWEDFLFHASNFQLDIYGSKPGRLWTDSMNPSFPTVGCILEHFHVYPSIVNHHEHGPVILTCRNHNKSSTERYLHVPENPYGTLFTPHSNQYAPVVIKTRCIRRMKKNHFSDTFSTAMLQGGYDGYDSSYVTSKSCFQHGDNLSALRDSLSIGGREDIHHYVAALHKDYNSSTFLPEHLGRDIIQRGKSAIEAIDIKTYLNAATYIPIETAMNLQEKIYSKTGRTIKIYKNEDDLVGYNDLIQPPWPPYLIFVHPCDNYGERFGTIHMSSCGGWILLAILSTNEDLWEAVSNAVHNNLSWEGHWLKFTSKKLKLGSKRISQRSSHVFKICKDEELLNLFPCPLLHMFENSELLMTMFDRTHFPTVQIITNETTDSQIKNSTTILLQSKPTQQLQFTDFELRCVAIVKSESKKDWIFFSRHYKHVNWWVQHGRGSSFAKSTIQPGNNMSDAVLALYGRKNKIHSESLRLRYLACLGGQSCMYCATHKIPLITYASQTSEDRNVYCICKGIQHNDVLTWDEPQFSNNICQNKCVYICPHYKQCQVAICSNFHTLCDKHYKDQCASGGSVDYIFAVTKNTSTFQKIGELKEANNSLNGDGCLYCPEGDIDNANLDMIGPVLPHDIAEDLLVSEDEEEVSVKEASLDNNSDWEYILQENTLESNNNGNPNSHQNTSHDNENSNVFMIDVDTHPDEEQLEDITDNDPPPMVTNTHPSHTFIEYLEDADSKEVHTTPLYVLLNHQGHLLVRRNFKLRMSKRNSAFYQRIVAKEKSKTISLVYGEAMLFPDIFWYSKEDGSIPGALPTALWSDCSTLESLGIASMRNHARTRIHNPSLLCSTDTRYHFLQFDMLLNLGLRGKDTRLVLHRGFADQQGKGGVCFREHSDSAEVYGDTTENRANVHKLAALVADKRPHYFFTQSCNQQTCKGLRVLRAWITSHTANEKISEKYGVSLHDAANLLRQSAASYVLRSWNEVIDVWMKYIIYSPEAPLHEIEYAWWRKEFQDKQGNPSHIHAILCTKKDITQHSQFMEVLQKIRGSLADLLHYEELLQLTKDGLISSTDQYHDILTDALRYLTHRCNVRCQVPRILEGGEQLFICKAPNNYSLSPEPQNHTIQKVQVEHTKESLDLLEDLGMIEWDDFNKISYTILDNDLSMERHIPRCSKYNSKFSPTNGDLFVRYPSAQNLQFCTGHSISSYLVKYVSGIDEVALVQPKPIMTSSNKNEGNECSYNGGEFKGIYHSLKNTKIAGNKKKESKLKASVRHHGRPLTQMECLTVIDGCDLVNTTIEFIHMPTCAREYRVAIQSKHIKSYSLRPQDEQTILAVIGQTVRNNIPNLPEERKFTSEQIVVIKDELLAPLSIDAATIFSIRPPELRFVNQMKLYLKWFVRKQVVSINDATKCIEYCSSSLHKNITKNEWLDGLNFKVLLRKGAIEECLEYALDVNSATLRRSNMHRQMCALLTRINRLHEAFELGVSPLRENTVATARQHYKELSQRFLHPEASMKLPTIWSTPVYPKSKSRFLIHVLLSFGKFTTEYELMKTGNIRDAYIHAQIIKPEHPHQSIHALLKRYVKEILLVQPGSTFQFDRNLCAAHGILSETLFQEHWNTNLSTLLQPPQMPVISIQTPAVLFSKMKAATDMETQQFQELQRNLLVKTLLNDLVQCGFSMESLPHIDELTLLHPEIAVGTRNPNPPFFPPPRSINQSSGSYVEQRKVIEEAKHAIDAYCVGKAHKNIVIVGGPGNGKTTVAQLITVYALYQGLRGIPTSIVADRAKQLGGIHIHQLCCIKPTSDKKSPGRMAENAIATIYRHPEILHFWRTVDFLFFDELGLFSAEMIATIDIIVRYCRESSGFLGGLLCFGSLDILQLMPFHGTPFMLSMNVITDFHFRELTHSVRAANDIHLQRICELSRTIRWTQNEEKEFQTLITDNCNFVNDFHDPMIPKDAIYVFGRKAPCQYVEKIVLQHIEETTPLGYIISKAYDEESSTAGNWKHASDPVQKRLNRNIKEKDILPIFEKGRYEFTYNEKGRFQQGQLAVVLTVNKEAVIEQQDITVLAAPPGCKEFPSLEDGNDNVTTESRLQSMGWTKVKVPYRTTQSSSVFNGIIARRTQYGMRLRVATTIHASMGSTLTTLVTAVTNDFSERSQNMDYTLWEAAQIVVLLSRTRKCSDIYFVGKPKSISAELLRVLRISNRFLPHIRQLLMQLCDEVNDTPLIQVPLVFRPCDTILPKTAAVYLLVSTVDVSYLYIGETNDIRKRLNMHNSYNRGSKMTSDTRLQPWAVMGYATGFRNRFKRQSFEAKWKKRLENMTHDRTAERILSTAHQMAIELNSIHITNEETIRVVRCGTVGFASSI